MRGMGGAGLTCLFVSKAAAAIAANAIADQQESAGITPPARKTE
jgi:hypothetical protein